MQFESQHSTRFPKLSLSGVPAPLRAATSDISARRCDIPAFSNPKNSALAAREDARAPLQGLKTTAMP
jgi:hypothetical protein